MDQSCEFRIESIGSEAGIQIGQQMLLGKQPERNLLTLFVRLHLQQENLERVIAALDIRRAEGPGHQ